MEFALAALVALAVTPLAAALARRTGVVDRPGPLKPQERPVPYLGGVPVLCGCAIGVAATGRYVLLLPLVLAFALGVVDDIRAVPPRVRFGLELLIGVAAAVVVPGDPFVKIATAGFVVVLLNAVNLVDGQDGLAGSLALVAALAGAFLGNDATPFALALAGGLAGFLVFNRPPARIYLGDGGAYLVGTTLAMIPSLADDGVTRWSVWFAAPLIVAVPILDTAIAVWRRLRTRRPLFTGDRSHVYDQLVDRGVSVAASTSILALGQVVLSTLGVVAAGLEPLAALAMTLGVALVAVVASLRAGFV
ncbi:MAG: undecaprenyl/decaprenyl-phosphate alpha-N-acetylglucosaminyl 1-phosphate transferase [Acidimicrobiia bacterium]|nr:undecaprenyl/decaprenyl-phosphate alpha-N-acetylglucosaminyl 1-phosphate transferase [Acidimicrobiia bacterium]